MTQHQKREYAFLLLYEAMMRGDTPDTLEELFTDTEQLPELEKILPEVKQTVSQALAQKDILDEIIAKYSEKRTLNRIAVVNRTILLLALFELRNTPKEVAAENILIYEAVRLSKAYAYPEDTAFINGVLGNYVRDHAASKEDSAHEFDPGD